MRGLVIGFVTLCVLIVAFDPARADVAWRVDRLAPGAMLFMEAESGAVIAHRLQAHADGQTRFDTWQRKGDERTYLGYYLTNAKGEVLKVIGADGGVTLFEPHRCTRTIGECRYTIVHPGGFREPRVRVTRETETGIAWQEFGLDGLMTSGGNELDDNGLSVRSWQKDHTRGGLSRSRLLDIAYR